MVDANGAERALSEGDALQLTGPPAADATTAALSVLSSKGGAECHKGAIVSVAFNDLQDMQNHMRETIDQGMGELQITAGKGGLPTVPPSAAGQPTRPRLPRVLPDRTKRRGLRSRNNRSRPIRRRKKLSPECRVRLRGRDLQLRMRLRRVLRLRLRKAQSLEDTISIEGQPTKIVDLKTKKIYYFKDGLKVTFQGGKSTNIE